MITFEALKETAHFIKNIYGCIENERFLMNYIEYYDLKAKYTKQKDKKEIFKIFECFTPINLIPGNVQFRDKNGDVTNILILTDDERIIKDIIE